MAESIIFLCAKLHLLTAAELKAYIETYNKRGLRLFTTCSFQTHSIVLVHMLMTIDRSIPVYFINTGFHFAETIDYKNTIGKLLGIEIKSVHSPAPKYMQKDLKGNLLFTSDAEYCCYLNKVLPMEPLLMEYDVWINGVRRDQSQVRGNFKVEEAAPHNVIRLHPMLDWNSKMIYEYLQRYKIPPHPLEAKGYFSIGCEPCTSITTTGSREGRWLGLNKSECGLNTDLIVK